MLRITTICVLILSVAVLAYGQDNTAKTAGTQITAKSKKAIDVENSQVGDDLNFEVTTSVDAEGVKVDPGAELMARIVNVEKISDTNKSSRISILFDFIHSGEEFLPCKALIVGIENAGQDVKVESSENFEGGTRLTLAGQNIKIPEGVIFKIRLIKEGDQ